VLISAVPRQDDREMPSDLDHCLGKRSKESPADEMESLAAAVPTTGSSPAGVWPKPMPSPTRVPPTASMLVWLASMLGR
jgi:hypothetical protein